MFCYPTVILPRTYYREEIDVKQLYAEVTDFWVSRRGEGVFEEVATRYGNGWKIERDAFGDKIVGYSMNIEGALFDSQKHVCIRQMHEGSRPWKEKKAIFILRYFRCYERVVGFPIYFKASVFQNMTIPYEKNVDKKEYNVLSSDAHKHKMIEDKFKESGLVKAVAHTYLKHAPSNLNYWHIQLQTFAANSDEKELESESKWRKPIFDYILGILMSKKNIHVEIEEEKPIPEKYYIERKPCLMRKALERYGLVCW